MLHPVDDFPPSRLFAIAGSLALLSACGGGGGGNEATPNRAPVAVAKMASEAVAGSATLFDTVGTADPDGSLASKIWSYGDGKTGTADSHVYAQPGTFTATYTVTDDRGATSTASINVTVKKCSAAGLSAAQLSPYPSVCIQTTMGELVVEVFPSEAPVTSANFLKYVDDGFYVNTIFHRVIRDFVVQGGGFTAGMQSKAATYPAIVLESNNGLKNWQYTLAMARTPQPNSATSQFFVNAVDNPGLDYNPAQPGANGYAVFGQVISGTTVVDRMAVVGTGVTGGFADVPVQDVVIRSALRVP